MLICCSSPRKPIHSPAGKLDKGQRFASVESCPASNVQTPKDKWKFSHFVSLTITLFVLLDVRKNRVLPP